MKFKLNFKVKYIKSKITPFNILILCLFVVIIFLGVSYFKFTQQNKRDTEQESDQKVNFLLDEKKLAI
ncbi:hypothetical protein [Candidatus Phytoplasma asteris]|uniref:hypothetical protein n=1 Tax=Candidatus Phytoplasma asteris TaxID=85620 RepID=UPI0039E1F5E2